MAEALAAFEAGARSDGHTPDSGLRFRLFHSSFSDRLTYLPFGNGREPVRAYAPSAQPQPR